MRRTTLIVVLSTLVTTPLIAATEAPQGPQRAELSATPEPGEVPDRLTPEKAVAIALGHHAALRAADLEVSAAAADRALARSGWLPRVDLTEDLARSTNPVFVFASKLSERRFGPGDFAVDSLNRPDPFTNAATRLVVRQSVWDAGRTRLGGEAAGYGSAAAAGDRARTRDEVTFGAIRAFWDAVLADAMRTVAGAAEEAAKADAELAAQQVDAGMAVPSDRLSAEVRLAEVQAMRIRAEQGVRVARAALRQALGLREDRPFDLAPPAVEPSGPAGETEEAVRRALAMRPDLAALDRRIDQAAVGERIARSHRLPEIGLGAQYEWDDESAFGTAGRNWTVGVSLRLPLFDGFETRARAARAQADLERLRAQREALAEGIRLEVRAASADRIAAQGRLSVAASALGQAEEALRIVRERYGEGMAVMVELLGAEAARTAAQGNRAAAERDSALAAASLDLAVGGKSR